MSGDESDGGGDGDFSMAVAGMFWGNFGEGNKLDVDYMDKDALENLSSVTDKVADGMPNELQLQKDGTAKPGQQHADAAVRPAADAVDFEDEPTLSEDLEDDEEEEQPALKAPAAAVAGLTRAAAPLQQAARPASAAAAIPGHALVSGTWNADEDDYDGDGSFQAAATAPRAPAIAAATPLGPAAMAAASAVAASAAGGGGARSWLAGEGPSAAGGAVATGGVTAAQLQQQQLYALQQAQVARPGVAASMPPPLAGPRAASPAPPRDTSNGAQAHTPPPTAEQTAAQHALAEENYHKGEQQRALGFSYLGRANGQEIISYSDLFQPSDVELRWAQASATGQADAGYAQRVDSAARRAEAVRAAEATKPAAEEEDESELVSLKDLQQLLPSLRLQDPTEVVSEDGDDDEQLPGSRQRRVSAGVPATAAAAGKEAKAAVQKGSEAGQEEERGRRRVQQQQEARRTGQPAPISGCALPNCKLHVLPTGCSGTSGLQPTNSLARQASGSTSSQPAIVAELQSSPQRTAAAATEAAVISAGEAVVLDDWEAAVIWDVSKGPGGSGAEAPVVEEVEEEEASEAMQIDSDQLSERRHSHAGASSSKALTQRRQQQQQQQRFNPSHALGTSSGSNTVQGLRPAPLSLQQALGRLSSHPRMLRLAPSFAALEAAEAAAKAAAEAAAAAAQAEGNAAGKAGDAPAAPKVVGAAAASAAAKKYSKGEEIFADAAAGAAAAAERLRIQFAGELLAKPMVKELLGDDWEEAVVFDAAEAGFKALKPVLLDLNDPHMVFESERAGAYDNAGAMVKLPPPKIKLVMPPSAAKEEDPTALSLAHLNTSKDHLYATGRKGRTDKSTGFQTRHSIMAVSLSSLPLYPNDAFSAFWHRPRALWSPTALAHKSAEAALKGSSKKAKEKAEGAVAVHFRTLAGMFRSASWTADVDGFQQALAVYWGRMAKGFMQNGLEEVPVMMGGQPFGQLDVTRPLFQLGMTEPINTVIPLWRTLHPLPTISACALNPPDSEEPRRPPGAFKTLKSLSAQSGHLLLVEYMEERPMMLLQPGMGLKLVTYYQRMGEDDVTHQHLLEEYTAGLEQYQAPPLHSDQPHDGLRRPYTIGAVSPLMPDDPSPFYDLINIPPGASQFAVDTPNFRAPAAPHVASSSDFVLVRSPRGAMHLREVNGTVLVGQQHPSVRVMVPQSEEARKFEHMHFQVHVLRELRTKQERLAKKGTGEVATVSVKELEHKFRAFLANQEGVVKAMLKDRCFCVPVPGTNEGVWCIKEGAKVPVEQELRKLVTPDMYCQYEALCAGIQWARMNGMHKLEQVPPASAERLRVVLDALPQDLDSRQAAAILELAHLASPWKLSDAYLTILKDKKLASFVLKGIGDPTARGRGFSFIREEVKRHGRHDAPGPGVTSREDGTITGTDADLRKLGFKDAGDLLMNKFAMPKDKVDDLKRWRRIEKIRELCRNPKYAHIVNADPALAQYVRFVRVSAAENLNKLRQEAANIFAAQLEALHEDWADEAAPDPVSLDQVVTSRTGDVDSGATAGTSGGSRGAAGRHQMDEDQAYYEQMRSTGLVKGGLAPLNRQGGAALPRHQKLEASPGDRRIRRTITYPGPDGQPVTRVIIYTDRDKMAALNALYRQSEGFGERKIPRAGQKRPKREAAAVAAAAGRGQGILQGPSYMAAQAPAARLTRTADPTAASPSASARPGPSERRTTKKASRATTAKTAAPAGAAGGLRRLKSSRSSKKRRRSDEESDFDLTESDEDAGALEGSGSESLDAGAFDDGSDDDAGSDSPRRGGKRGGGGGGGSAKKSKRQRTASIKVLEGGAIDAAAAAFLAPAPSGQEDGDGSGYDAAAYGAASGSAGAAAGEGGAGGYMGGQAAGVAAGGAVGEVSPEAAAAELAARLGLVIRALIKWQDSPSNMQAFKSSFKKQVPSDVVPDYNKYVAKADEMWLERIADKARKKSYQSVFEFKQDVQQIHTNATKYNNSATALFRTPQLAALAQQMVEYCEQQLAAQGEALMYWSNLLEVAAVNRARSNPAQHAKQLQKAIAQAKVVGGDVAPPGWQWIECESCKQWRLMTIALFEELGLNEDGAQFTCEMDTERTGASCNYPPEY